jgi:hypothetical protein
VHLGACKSFEPRPLRKSGGTYARNLSDSDGRVWDYMFAEQTEYLIAPVDRTEIAVTKPS